MMDAHSFIHPHFFDTSGHTMNMHHLPHSDHPHPHSHHAMAIHILPQDPHLNALGVNSTPGAGILGLSGNGAVRKRPKYTRSKTGCLTCRVKKIKCDEVKPICSRCAHGQRECTWPPDIPKKRTVRRRRPSPDSGAGNADGDPEARGRMSSIDTISSSVPVSRSISRPNSCCDSGDEGASSALHSRQHSHSHSPPLHESDDRTGGFVLSQPPSTYDSLFPHADLPGPTVKRGHHSKSSKGSCCGGKSEHGSRHHSPSASLHLVDPSHAGESHDTPGRCCSHSPPPMPQALPEGVSPVSPTWFSAPGTTPPRDVPEAPFDLAGFDLQSLDSLGIDISAILTPMANNAPLLASPLMQQNSLELSTSGWGNSTARIEEEEDEMSKMHRDSGQWHSTPLIKSSLPDPIEPFFKTVAERNLIRHYCNSATSLIMAVPSCPSLNPVLATTLPLVLSLPPNVSPDVEALRLSLLGVSAVHQAFLHSRSASSYPLSVPISLQKADEMMRLATTLRQSANRYLNQSCQTLSGTRSDAALGASITIALIDIFAGGHGYAPNLTLAKALVGLRGGPALITANNAPSRASFGGGVTVSAARLLLEILAVYDTFASLTSGEPPSLLGRGKSDWWFDGDKQSYHKYSIEQLYGMSRGMIDMVARVSALLSRARPIAPILPTSLETNDSDVVTEARALYMELENFTNPCREHGCVIPEAAGSPCHPRVDNGNEAHRMALQVILLRDVFQVPRTDPRVQNSSKEVVSLCLQSTRGLGMGVDLTWPVIIAGCQLDIADRTPVLETFDGFRRQCCFEIDTAEQICVEVWRRIDSGLPRADWRSVVQDLDLKVLLL